MHGWLDVGWHDWVTYHTRTPSFEWWMIGHTSKNGYFKEIGLCIQNLLTILDVIVNIHGGEALCNALNNGSLSMNFENSTTRLISKLYRIDHCFFIYHRICTTQCHGRSFRIIGQKPSMSKTNLLHVVIDQSILLIWAIINRFL